MAISSLKPEECIPDIFDLEDQERTVLEEWLEFFKAHYSCVGTVSY